MQISLLDAIGQFGAMLQNSLFPAISEELGALSSKQEQLIRTLTLLGLEGFAISRQGLVGRRGHDQSCIARAFVAKAVYNFAHTRALIDRLNADVALRRLCGWESAAQVPDETVFSRAFARFAANEFPQRVHEALIEKTQKDRLIGHISRDATAIDAREKATPKPEPVAKVKQPRRKKDQPKRPDQMKRMERQASMSLPEMMADLPRCCDVGRKSNSKGNAQVWIGYKLHVDVADGQIPISCILTSASLHDSQVALPLASLTAQRVTSLYDLMDAGYDADGIRDHSRSLGHVPIIERVKRVEMPKHEASRYRERTSVERVYSRLKDEFGGRYVRVRGNAKVMAHLMFGLLALTVDQILRVHS
jgi:IS5 family transposase